MRPPASSCVQETFCSCGGSLCNSSPSCPPSSLLILLSLILIISLLAPPQAPTPSRSPPTYFASAPPAPPAPPAPQAPHPHLPLQLPAPAPEASLRLPAAILVFLPILRCPYINLAPSLPFIPSLSARRSEGATRPQTSSRHTCSGKSTVAAQKRGHCLFCEREMAMNKRVNMCIGTQKSADFIKTTLP